MTIEQIIFLALVQGITEFLPISSSGHLQLVHQLTPWPDQGLLMDVAVHVGTLFAVVLYFWRDLLALAGGALNLLRGRWTSEGRLALLLVVATIPVIIVGFILASTGAEEDLRTAETVAWANLVFAVLLYFGDKMGALTRRLEEMRVSGAVLVGLAQVLALIPGASRAGVTMTAARFLGYERTEAARFSMLLSIPTIVGAGVLGFVELMEGGNQVLQLDAAIGAGLAFISALFAIWGLMKLLQNMSLTPFVIYRIVLGVALLGWLYLA